MGVRVLRTYSADGATGSTTAVFSMMGRTKIL
jgi:hypothetical protein